jgi:hypothetical protein
MPKLNGVRMTRSESDAWVPMDNLYCPVCKKEVGDPNDHFAFNMFESDAYSCVVRIAKNDYLYFDTDDNHDKCQEIYELTPILYT